MCGVLQVFTIPGTVSPPLTMFGWSRAMSGTGFFIPELKWMLDAGLSNLPQATHIFLTHGHQDHSLCLSGCALGAWVSHKIPPQLFCPSSLHGYVTRYVRCGDYFGCVVVWWGIDGWVDEGVGLVLGLTLRRATQVRPGWT